MIVSLTLAAGACGGSDEDRIAGRLEELAQTVSIEGLEAPMIREARAQRLVTLLAPDVSVDLGAPLTPARGADEVARLVTQVRVPPGGVAIELDGVQVTLDESGRRALANLTVRVMAGPEVGGELLATRVFEAVFVEVAGEWVAERVQFVDVQ